MIQHNNHDNKYKLAYNRNQIHVYSITTIFCLFGDSLSDLARIFSHRLFKEKQYLKPGN